MKSPQPNNSMSCLNNGVECLSTALYRSIINPHNNHLQWEKKRQLRFPVFATQVNQRAGPTLEMMSGSRTIIPSSAVIHRNNKPHTAQRKDPLKGIFLWQGMWLIFILIGHFKQNRSSTEPCHVLRRSDIL